MIDKLLPSSVASTEAFADPPDAYLFPEEEKAVSQSVEKRRREFTTVRHCARRSLAALGLPPAPLLSGERGAPIWPSGVVGSMTHCAGYRAAAVARDHQVRTLGIDAEPRGPLPAGVLESIALPTERDHCAELTRLDEDIPWDRLLFSAKESLYKAWFPVTRRWLGFEDAQLTFFPQDGSFTARVLVTPPEQWRSPVVEGRWVVENNLVLTAIVLQHG